MRLAKEYADKYVKTHGPFDDDSFVISNPWVNLWKAFSDGKADENDVKSCFILGYVTELFRDYKGATYKMKKNRLNGFLIRLFDL